MAEEFVVEKHPVEEIPSVSLEPSPIPHVQFAPEPAPASAEEGLALELSRQGWPNNDYQPVVEQKPKKSHRGLWITLGVIGVVIVAVAIFLFIQYRAVMGPIDQLKADGQVIADNVQIISDSVQRLDFETALGAAMTIQDRAEHMRGIISTKEFDLASRIPTYGGDVLTAREMLDIVIDADSRAVIPVLQALVDHPLESLLTADSVDAAGVYAILDAVEAAIPIAEADIDALEALDPFVIPDLQQATAQVFESLPEARQALADVKSTLATAKPLLDTYLGRDGKGPVAQLWPILAVLLGGEDGFSYEDIKPLLGLLTGEGDAGSLSGILPLLGLLTGSSDGNVDFESLLPLIGLLLGSDGGEGLGLDTIIPLLGLLLGGDSGDGGSLSTILSLLGLLSGGDDQGSGGFGSILPLIGLLTGSGDGEGGFFESVMPLLGLLFGGDASESSEPADEPATGTEDGGTFDLSPFIGLLFGDEDGDGGLIEDFLPLLLGGDGDGESEDGEDTEEGMDLFELVSPFLDLFFGGEDEAA